MIEVELTCLKLVRVLFTLMLEDLNSSSGDSLTTLLEGLASTSLLHAQDTASLTLIEVHDS